MQQQEVEISSIDLRYEAYRMKSRSAEKRLLASILDSGIRDPLMGVDSTEGRRILLDGFKRLRCARALAMSMVPYCCLGSDESLGILELIRVSNQKSLSILEQAKLIDELKSVHKMSVSEIAEHLERSKAWVSLRAGMIREMGEVMQREIFAGRFPVYSYMYTLRPFMRINKIARCEVEDFICSVAGRGLSVRDIELLARGYFKGSDEFRRQIKEGNISWGLRSMKHCESSHAGQCTVVEQKMLRELEIVQKYMQRITFQLKDNGLKGNAFLAQANLLAAGVLKNLSVFEKAVREFYDKSAKAPGNLPAS